MENFCAYNLYNESYEYYNSAHVETLNSFNIKYNAIKYFLF